MKISGGYLRQTHSRAKAKAKKGMSDLIFLAEKYPDYIDDSDLVRLVAAKLSHGIITDEDRHRTPQNMRKKSSTCFQIAGTLHEKSGAPLIKPELNAKFRLAFNLLKSIHEQLGGISPFQKRMQIFRLVKLYKKIDLHYSQLVKEKQDIAMNPPNNLLSKFGNENQAKIEIASTDPETIRILVIEDLG